jgi:hypothetical protein
MSHAAITLRTTLAFRSGMAATLIIQQSPSRDAIV